MTGYVSKRQAAWNKFAEPWNGTGLWQEIDNALTYQTYIFATPPKPVGYWVLGQDRYHTMFPMYEKPTDYQIYNTEQLLGWKWKDA